MDDLICRTCSQPTYRCACETPNLMKKFPERATELSENLPWHTCVKKRIVIQAVQINEEFRVDTLEGDYKQGKPGDYLMWGIDHELYICDKDIFEKTYDWVDEV